jgi:hypothetical protein
MQGVWFPGMNSNHRPEGNNQPTALTRDLMSPEVGSGSFMSFGETRGTSAYAPIAEMRADINLRREWNGPAALPPPTAVRVRGGLVRSRSTTMPRKSTVHAVTAIGIDMGKTTLHMRCHRVARAGLARAYHIEACEPTTVPTLLVNLRRLATM